MDVSVYRDEHHRILRRAAELLSTCERVETAADMDETRQAVDRLDAVLRSHLMREDDELYGQLSVSDDPEVRATAAKAMEDMGGLTQGWIGFVDQCRQARFPQDRDRLSAGCRALLKALAERVRWENEVLYPMAEGLNPGSSGN